MAKAGVRHEAFLDLEAGLAHQLLPRWERRWGGQAKAIADAADAGDWATAHDRVQDVDLTPILGAKNKTLETLGMAALLLGASRFGRVDRTHVYKDPPKDWLALGVTQTATMLGEHASAALRHELHLLLDKHEYADDDNPALVVKASGRQKYMPATVRQVRTLRQHVRTVGLTRGANYVGLAANLHTSRLSTAGFLLEATARGVKQYQVSAVLDIATCPVCQRMHGQTFPVSNGITHLNNVLSATSPSVLKTINGWPSRSGSGLQAFLQMDTAALLGANLHLPEYHPGCRCIVVPAGEVETVDIPEAIAGLTAGLAYDALAQRLFGDRSDLQEESEGLFALGALSGLYGDEGDED